MFRVSNVADNHPPWWVIGIIVLIACGFLFVGWLVQAETADIYDGSGDFAGQIIESDDGGTVTIYDGDGNFAGQIVDQDESDDD